MIMDMSFVYVCTDNVGVVSFRKSPCQFTAKTIGFFWGDFSRSEGLPEMISNNIIGSLDLTCLAKVLLLTVNELSISNPTVTFPAGNQSPTVCLSWVCDVVDDICNGSTNSAPFSNMQWH